MRKGFSFIELMAVTTIVGLVACILFPVFAKSKGAAEKASCLANLKELSLASLIYAQDHDDRFFPFGYSAGKDYLTWWGDLSTGDPKRGFLYPYTKSGRIRGCPAALDLPNIAPFTFTMGYGMNFRLFYSYFPEPAKGFRTTNSSEIERPGETLLTGDSAAWDRNRKMAVGSAWLFGDSWNSHLHARHAGNLANVAWLDGHATSHRLYYHVAVLGRGRFTVEPDDLKAFRLGDLLKYPRESPEASINSQRDQFYFLLRKPSGL